MTKECQSGSWIDEKIILSMGVGLIDDFIRNILSIPFCPCHFVHTILSNAILSIYHFVHTILSVPYCPMPFCPRTFDLSISDSFIPIRGYHQPFNHSLDVVKTHSQLKCTLEENFTDVYYHS